MTWSLTLTLTVPALCAAAETGAPLGLDEAVRIALRQHPQVLAAQGNAAAATARVGEARSNWLPSLQGNGIFAGSYNYQTGEPPPNDTRRLTYNANIQGQQLIYDFGHTSGLVGSAIAAARAAQGDLGAARAQIALTAVNAYYAVLRDEAMQEVAERNLKQNQALLDQAQSFFQIGTHPEIDVLTARTGVAQAQLNLIQTKNNILTDRVQLMQALGATDPAWLKRPLQAQPPGALPEEGRAINDLLDAALSQRPDYFALRARVVVAEQNLRAARANHYPQFNFNFSTGVSGVVLFGQKTGTVIGNMVSSTTAGQPLLAASGNIALTLPLFSGLQVYYNVREMAAALAAAQANLEALRQQVLAGLQQAIFTVQTDREAEAAAQAVQDQAALQLAVASGRYQAGVGSVIELGTATVGDLTARAQRIQADFNLAMARAALRWQLGQLGTEESRK